MDADQRFSPAGAGNTIDLFIDLTVVTVQPRGCGEHRTILVDMAESGGSAPRVRGTQVDQRHLVAGERFSPAGAGNTGQRSRPAFAPSVQPRGCGEHRQLLPAASEIVGSAPRVRGTLVKRGFRDYEERFSPAGAGNTLLVTGCLSKGFLQYRNVPGFSGLAYPHCRRDLPTILQVVKEHCHRPLAGRRKPV